MALRYIIFDLDDTVYPRGTGLMQEVGHRIRLWLCNHLGMTLEEASVVQQDYFLRYGTTLGGLLALHDVDVPDYLLFVHDVPVEEYLGPNSALDAMLDGIPLRKAIYTNGTSAHGWRVLQELRVADHFEQVIGIEEVGLRNKASRDGYEYMLTLLGAQGSECIMVEDTVRNLQPAKALGLGTVLVGVDGTSELDSAVYENVDYAVESVLEVGQVIHDLLQ